MPYAPIPCDPETTLRLRAHEFRPAVHNLLRQMAEEFPAYTFAAAQVAFGLFWRVRNMCRGEFLVPHQFYRALGFMELDLIDEFQFWQDDIAMNFVRGID